MWIATLFVHNILRYRVGESAPPPPPTCIRQKLPRCRGGGVYLKGLRCLVSSMLFELDALEDRALDPPDSALEPMDNTGVATALRPDK